MLTQDIRYAFRSFRRSPLFAAIIVLTLAIGIGANTAIFSVVHAALLRGLPYHEPEKLAVIWSLNPLISIGFDTLPTSAGDFYDWRAQSRSFAVLAGFRSRPFNLSGAGDIPVRVNVITATGDFFRVFDVKPAVGRTFTTEEDSPGRRRVAVLSDHMWRSRFGANADAVGQTIQLNGEGYTIIGVMPPEMRFPGGAEMPAHYGFAARPDVWVPIGLDDKERQQRNAHNILVVGRLMPGVSAAQAKYEMRALQARIATDHPNGSRGWEANVVPLDEQTTSRGRLTLLLLLGAVGLVLLIACANVANLMLARANSRAREIAVRQALGANRRRIVRQLLTESILLSLAGGAVGLALAALLTPSLAALSPPALPGLDQVGINGWVLLFTLSLSGATGILFGVAPAMNASRMSVVDSLKQGDCRGTMSSGDRQRRLFVVTEVALSVVLTAAAGLVLRSFAQVLATDPGFATDSVLVMEIGLPAAKYRHREQQAAFFDRALMRLNSMAGVRAVGAVSSLPLTNNENIDSVSVEGHSSTRGEPLICDTRSVGGAYFEVLGIPLIEGRLLTDADQTSEMPAIVVSESLARKAFQGQNAIGRRMRFSEQQPWMRVVGIVRDVRNSSLEQPPRPQLYVPYHHSDSDSMNIVMRSFGDPSSLAVAARREIAALDPEQAVANIRTMEQVVSAARAARLFATLLLAFFAGCALLLTAIGLYGVMSYNVGRRTGEMGLRTALGATRGSLVRLIVGQGLRLTMGGILIGLAGAVAVAHAFDAFLYGVTAIDPLTFAMVPLVLVFVAVLACYLPAHRAACTEPMAALRQE